MTSTPTAPATATATANAAVPAAVLPPLQIGPHTIESPVVLAPMAGTAALAVAVAVAGAVGVLVMARTVSQVGRPLRSTAPARNQQLR